MRERTFLSVLLAGLGITVVGWFLRDATFAGPALMVAGVVLMLVAQFRMGLYPKGPGDAQETRKR